MTQKKWVSRLVMGMFFLLIAFGANVSAANVRVTSCVIETSNHSMVDVRANGSASVAGTDGKYYLYALMPYENGVTKESLQLASVRKQGTLSFRVALNRGNANSVLYRKFVVAVRSASGNKYTVVSNALYITNPQVLAKYTYAFPKAASKKGLHIQPSMLSDAEDLRIKHAAVNICLDTFVATNSLKNSRHSYAYTYQGKRYWFTKYACEEVDRQVKKLSETGVVVSGILLLREQGAGSVLVAPNARGKGKSYYGFNTMNKEGVDTLAALISFLGERYTNTGKKNGRIVNWIVGNEVNYYDRYNYLGNLSFADYVEAYARSFRVVSTALHSVCKNARVYISLDHCWNILQPDGKSYTSKRVLDQFAAVLKNEGDIVWNLAFHPYPAPLTDPAFWDDNVSNSDSTKTVTMKNIGYLTDYLNRNFRKDVRVILSEQGFTSKVGGKTQEKKQAAAFAYAYYITEFNSKIDSFIMNRHVDHVEETRQGLNLGLWTNKSGQLEYASKKKAIYDVFKYIDSASSQSVSKFALSYIHASSWASKISGFSWSRFKKMGTYQNSTASKISKLYSKKSIKNSLKYSYNGNVKKKGSGVVITVNPNANPNLYQGAGWTFSKKLNFSSRSNFVCKMKVTGLKEKYALVRIRFFSGTNIYEAQAKLQANKTKLLSVNLKKWKYRKSVSKIQIWVRPYKGTRWKKGGKITIAYMKQAKKTKK